MAARAEASSLACSTAKRASKRVEPLLLISREREFIVHELVQATLGIVVGPAIGGKRSEASGERRQQDREDKVKLLQRL